MTDWIGAAAAYGGAWLEHQARRTELPGFVLSVFHRGRPVAAHAHGLADLDSGEAMTAGHRFRIASLSKTFTAVGVLTLVERGVLRLQDPAGRHVPGLHEAVAAITLEQLLSHTGGLSRDGEDAGYFADAVPFPSRDRVRAALRDPPTIPPGQRFKYSNYGYALLGLVIEAATGEAFDAWIAREVLAPAGLRCTTPDAPEPGIPFACGHSDRLPLGRRLAIPGRNRTDAFSCVTGFTSTAAEVARFYAALSPAAAEGPLAPETRHAMTRPLASDPDGNAAWDYGLGVHAGRICGWDYYGHAGLFQGATSRVLVLPQPELSLALLVNAIGRTSVSWLEGVAAIFRRFHDGGAPRGHAADWTGRWWNMWGPLDLVAVGERVLAFGPDAFPPFAEASELALHGPDEGVVARAPAMERLGEPVRRIRRADGAVAAIRIGGAGYVAEQACARGLLRSYGPAG